MKKDHKFSVLLVAGFVVLFIASCVAGFSGVMVTMWCALATLCVMSWFRSDNFFFRYLVEEGEINGLSVSQVYSRAQTVSLAFVVIIPTLWLVSK